MRGKNDERAADLFSEMGTGGWSVLSEPQAPCAPHRHLSSHVNVILTSKDSVAPLFHAVCSLNTRQGPRRDFGGIGGKASPGGLTEKQSVLRHRGVLVGDFEG